MTDTKPLPFPRHAASLHLTHNEHKGFYATVADCVRDGEFGYRDQVWVSPEQKQKAIDTDEIWTLQWYPDTPIGFCVKSACDLDVLLAHVAANE